MLGVTHYLRINQNFWLRNPKSSEDVRAGICFTGSSSGRSVSTTSCSFFDSKNPLKNRRPYDPEILRNALLWFLSAVGRNHLYEKPLSGLHNNIIWKCENMAKNEVDVR